MSELESLRVGQAVRTGQGAACTHTHGHTHSWDMQTDANAGVGTQTQKSTRTTCAETCGHRKELDTQTHREQETAAGGDCLLSPTMVLATGTPRDCPAWCQASGLGPGPRLLLPWVLRQGPTGILISERIGQMLFPRREPLCLLSQPPHAVSKTQTGWPTALGTHSPMKGGGNPKD